MVKKIITKFIALIFIISVLVGNITLSTKSVYAEDEAGLLSKGRPATASSVNKPGVEEAGNATDGNTSTVWAGTYEKYPQWWRVDLGSVKEMGRIEISWMERENRIYKYIVETSDDDKTYKTIVDNLDNRIPGAARHMLSKGIKARYVRVTISGCSRAKSSAAFYEFKVYDFTPEKQVEPKLKLDKPIVFKAPEKLDEKMKVSVVLFVDKPIAYLGNKKIDIDSNDLAITPIIKDSKTLVPVRFIAEATGAQVGWDDNTSTATIKNAVQSIDITIGKNEMLLDGMPHKLDVPAQVINGRTYMPLRDIVEAMGKKVFWDDRGLIVISNYDNIFDREKESQLIDQVCDIFN